MKFYAGIGSRETPPEILDLMESIAYRLARLVEVTGDYHPSTYDGWVLRSGGAPGADQAFERGAMRGMDGDLLEPWPQIFLPWKGFEKRPVGPDHFPPPLIAFDIAAKYHPSWSYLSRGARALHARNVQQILGPNPANPTLSSFVACWTKRAKGGGGTGQAIRVAGGYAVPVYDLADPAVRERFEGDLDWTTATEHRTI